MNSYAGQAPVTFGGKTYTLYYDWDAIGHVQSVYGTNSIAALFKGMKPELLAGLMAAGLRRYHPEFTPAVIMALSPPYEVCRLAVDKAIAIAYFGRDAVETQKKSLAMKLMTKIGIMSGKL